MIRHSPQKSNIVIFLLSMMIAAGFLMRFQLAEKGVDYLLSRMSKQEVVYERREWQGSSLVYHQLKLGSSFFAEKVALDLSFQLSPSFLKPSIILTSPKITQQEQSDSKPALTNIFVPYGIVNPKIDVIQGAYVDSHGNTCFNFNFKSGSAKNYIGMLNIYTDHEIVRCDLHTLNGGVQVKWYANEASLSELITIAGSITPNGSEGWEEALGNVNSYGSAEISKNLQLRRIEATLELNNLSIKSASRGFECEAFNYQTTLSYPIDIASQPIWKQIKTEVLMRKGKIKLSYPFCSEEIALNNCEADLCLAPDQEPQFNMQGLLTSDGQSYPLHIEGNGSIQKNGSCILSGKAQLSQAYIAASFIQNDKNALLKTRFTQVDSTVLALCLKGVSVMFPQMEPFSVAQGALDGACELSFFHNRLQKVEWRDVDVKNLHIALSPSYEAYIPYANLQGKVDLDKLQIESLQAHLEQAAFKNGADELTQVSGTVIVLEDLFRQSKIEGEFKGMQGEINLSGHRNEVEFSLKSQASLSTWLSQPIVTSSPLVNLSVSGKKGSNGYALTGSFKQPEMDAELNFGLQIDATHKVQEGWYRSNRLSSHLGYSFLQHYGFKGDLEGTLNIEGVLKGSKTEGIISVTDLAAAAPVGSLSFKKPLHLSYSYDFSQKQFTGSLPLMEGSFCFYDNRFNVNNVESRIEIENHRLLFKHITASLESTSIKGHGEVILKDLSNYQLSFITESIEGDLSDLAKFSSTSMILPTGGAFSSGNKGLHLTAQCKDDKIDWMWNLRAGCKNITLPLTSVACLEHMQFNLEIDSNAQTAVLSAVQAQLKSSDQEPYHLTSNSIRLSNLSQTCAFDIHLSQKSEEVLKLAGSVEYQEPSCYQFLLVDEKNHFYASPWEMLSFKVKNGTEVIGLDFAPRLNGRSLYSQAAFLSEMGILSFDVQQLEFLQKLKGEINAVVRGASTEDISFEMIGQNLNFDGENIQQFNIKGKKIADEWVFETIHADDFFAAGSVIDGVCPSFEMKWKDMEIAGEAHLKDVLAVHIENVKGLLPPNYIVKGIGEIQGVLHPTPSLSGIQLAAYNDSQSVGKLDINRIAFDLKKRLWKADSIQIDAQVDPLARPLSAKVSAEGSSNTLNFKGELPFGQIAVLESNLQLNRFMGVYEDATFNFKLLAALNHSPLELHARLVPSKNWAGKIVVQGKDRDERLVAVLNDHLGLERIEGSLYGMHTNLLKNIQKEGYIGSMSVTDGSRLAHLFPKTCSFIKDVKGIELKGTWKGFNPHLTCFEGELLGRNFEYKGHLLNEMHAGVIFSPKKLTLDNLTLTDPSGSCSIKKIEGLKEETWHLLIPLIKAQNLKPSLMRRVDGFKSTIKPLTIRNLILTDVSLDLSKSLNLNGAGTLNFTNAFKKESSLFEAPITMLKNLGLDFELFTPTSGEITCTLDKGKIYLTELKNTFSEGRRSQFSIVSGEDPSFIDLDGNIHINMRMKQDVVLKLVEPFDLSIRGTLEHPMYGLMR